MRPTWTQIDLRAIRDNVRALADLVAPSHLCAVIKADAYGHGDVPVAEAALAGGAELLAVALVEEGARLRDAGIEAPILVLSEPALEDAAEIVRWNLIPSAYRTEFLAALRSVASGPLDVHLKVDTGMHRVGVATEKLTDLVASVREPLRLGAVFTHFPVADEDRDYTLAQIERFRQAVAGLDVPLHLANTAGAVLFPKARADFVRIGLGIYGLHPCDDTREVVSLRPAMSVISHVSFIQRLGPGERPSYGRRRPLDDSSTVATVPIGYADGVPRQLSELGAEVLIGGKRRHLAGTVTMDQLMVDMGDDPVSVGDEVVLIGRQGTEEISADEWAGFLDTVSYEIICGIGPRVPRRYVE